MKRRLAYLLLAGSLAACSSDKYDYKTWTAQLDDPHTSERAVTELEQLGNPGAIPDLGKAWAAQGKPVRLLQVIIGLARPMTPKEAEDKYFTDYQTTGRPANWDKALPFLKQAIDDLDDTNPRSIDSAAKAAAAIGEAGLADGLDSLIKLLEKPSTSKIIAAQVDAVHAMGKFVGDDVKGKATQAVQKILDHEPPPLPNTLPADQKAGATEKYKYFMLATNKDKLSNNTFVDYPELEKPGVADEAVSKWTAITSG